MIQRMLKEMEEAGMTIVRDVEVEEFQQILGSFYTDRAEKIGGTYVADLLSALEEGTE